MVNYLAFTKSPIAYATDHILFLVNVQVLLLIRQLVKCEGAIFDWTLEGSLFGMGAHMVKEVMPLAKDFHAMAFPADEDHEASSRVGINKFNLTKILA